MALPVTIPNSFANATSSIPLSQLDANFNTLSNAVNGINSGAETLANLVATTANVTTGNITTVNATTVDTTNIEVTNVKAKDGTASATIADSTGVMTIASSVLTTTDINGGTLDNVVIGGATANAATFTSITDSGNLTFTGTGNRITGDFSNATFANRVAFQTTTSNSPTTVYAIPNGSSTTSGFVASTDSSVTNGSEVRVLVTGTAATLTSSFRGSGTTLPLTFDVGGERMRIDTSGNVGIGTSNPAGYRMRIVGASGSGQFRAGTDSGSYLEMNGFDSNPFYCVIAGSSATAGIFGTQTNIPTVFFTNNTERARIDTSGNLLVGNTTASPSSAPEPSRIVSLGSSSQAAAHFFTDLSSKVLVYFSRTAFGVTGSISVSGSTTAYNTSSDYRLKHDIAPMTGALAKVAALKPVTYKWKADDSAGEGFIAHELQEVAPYAVSGEKDGEQMQGVDYGKLTPILTAALQEAIAKIETLEARLAVLEAK